MTGKNLSKAHFEAVAKVFHDVERDIVAMWDSSSESAQGMEGMRLLLATHLATVYEKANPNFDRTRFLLACGMRDAAKVAS